MNSRSFFALVLSVILFFLAIYGSNIAGNELVRNMHALKIKSLGVVLVLATWALLHPGRDLLGLVKGQGGWKWFGITLAFLCGVGATLYGITWNTHGAPHMNVASMKVSTWLLIALHIVLIGPLLEELFFRGILQGGMEKGYPAWVAAVIVAVAFSLMHGVQVPTIMFGAVTMCFLRYKTKAIWPGLLLHMVGNGTIFFIDKFVTFGNL